MEDPSLLCSLDRSQGEDGSNALILSGSKKKKGKKISAKEQEQQVKLSKNMQRKMRRLQEEEEKSKLRVQVMKTLECPFKTSNRSRPTYPDYTQKIAGEHKLADDKFALLQSSATIGKEQSMKEKLQRAMNYKRAGLPVPSDIPLFRQRRSSEQGLLEDEDAQPLETFKTNNGGLTNQRHNAKSGPGLTQVRYTPALSSKHMSSMDNAAASKISKIKQNRFRINPSQATVEETSDDAGPEAINVDEKLEKITKYLSNKHAAAVQGISTASLVDSMEEDNPEAQKGGKKRPKPSSDTVSVKSSGMETVISEEPTDIAVSVHSKDHHETPKKKKRKKKKSASAETVEAENDNEEVPVYVGPEDSSLNRRPEDPYLKENLNTQIGQVELKLQNVVVRINRPEDVAKGRENLPIVMMEQEIMETINENDVVIVCGETGCGKTTQVPQFLYEAGFGSQLCPARAGVIGVTQPRRVAVLATAKRVAYEMNVGLGQEVGFQVRHDRKIGDKSRIKFMTDGILLREVQADFLLKKYSVIVLDEAHERSLNTDILIGMLSRILPLRKSIYEDHCKKINESCRLGNMVTASETTIMPLKLVIMSATLRVEDFTSNRRMFPVDVPVIKVPARQFPVSVHFSAKTDLLDYVGRAEKKVCAIHRKLPPGGILVFVTGQREVEYLCRKLRRAFKPQKRGDQEQDTAIQSEVMRESDVQGLNMKSITDAMDGHLDNSTGADDTRLGFAEPDENNGENDGDGMLSHSEDENFARDGDEDSLSDSDEDEVINLQSSLDNVEDASKSSTTIDKTGTGSVGLGPASSTIGNNVIEGDSVMENPDQSKDPGPLYVLPLYAMLPAAAQLRVFAHVPDGARLVVVATNVAETSITIPGIRYVVDTGRSKERDFDRVSGVSKYEVRWISKASANQRAGRAGRTGPGHCYRLYSSAVFNNIFPKFAPPEMSIAPIEGIVLVMKRMGIDKVVNFPFPSPPERQALVEAERCLRALSALDSDTGLLTPIGRCMAVYPISPRHARMLLAALQASLAMNGKGQIVLAYAVAAAAALSLENPFLRESGIDTEESPSLAAAQEIRGKGKTGTDVKALRKSTKESKGPEEESPEVEKARRKQRRAAAGRAHGKFRNVHSDALSVVNALWSYEKSVDQESFCETNYLHAKTMQEMAKLRHQLSQLVIQYSMDAGAHFLELGQSGLTKEYLLEAEEAWQSMEQQKLNINQEMVVQQAICAGWADRVARRLSARERALIVEEDGKRKAIRYQACAVDETVFLHPFSALAREAPEFVVYNEIILTGRPYMWGVTGIQANWLVSHAAPLCTFSKAVTDPPPWYDHLEDKVMCWVLPSFGPHLWELPPHPFPMKVGKLRVTVFATALLQGKVVPVLSSLFPYLAADPAIIYKPESHGQKRVGELLHKLGTGVKAIDTRAKLASAWQKDPKYLYSEVLAWVQSKAHVNFENLWRQALQESAMEGADLFGKQRKTEKC